ncbi:MAG TPA: hypothetical protein VF642_05610 [Propionibacteriaceae bacterium]
MAGTFEAGDHFGWSLAVDDLTNDGRADILAADRPLRRGRRGRTQDTGGFEGHAEARDRFGTSLAMRPQPVGSAVGSSEAELVIGVPDEDIGTIRDAGLVQTVAVTPTTTRPVRSFTENSARTPGRVATGSRFGLSVVAMQGGAESLWAVSSPYQGAGSVFLRNHLGQERSWVPGSGGIPRPAGSRRFGWAVAGLESGR